MKKQRLSSGLQRLLGRITWHNHPSIKSVLIKIAFFLLCSQNAFSIDCGTYKEASCECAFMLLGQKGIDDIHDVFTLLETTKDDQLTWSFFDYLRNTAAHPHLARHFLMPLTNRALNPELHSISAESGQKQRMLHDLLAETHSVAAKAESPPDLRAEARRLAGEVQKGLDVRERFENAIAAQTGTDESELQAQLQFVEKRLAIFDQLLSILERQHAIRITESGEVIPGNNIQNSLPSHVSPTTIFNIENMLFGIDEINRSIPEMDRGILDTTQKLKMANGLSASTAEEIRTGILRMTNTRHSLAERAKKRIRMLDVIERQHGLSIERNKGPTGAITAQNVLSNRRIPAHIPPEEVVEAENHLRALKNNGSSAADRKFIELFRAAYRVNVSLSSTEEILVQPYAEHKRGPINVVNV